MLTNILADSAVKNYTENIMHKFVLHSEAEWEYACRAGTTTPFHFGETITTKLVNYDGNQTYKGAAKGEYRRTNTYVYGGMSLT